MRSANELLDEAAALRPDKEAVVCGDESITYRELCACVEATAAALAREGVRPGTRVGVLAPPSMEVAVVFFALQRIGAVAVMLSTKEHPGVVARSVRLSRCELVLHVGGEVAAAVLEEGVVRGLDVTGCASRAPSREEEAACDGHEWEPGEDALVVFTSGTTGAPKAIVHTESSLMAMWAIGSLGPGASTCDEVYASYAPMSHLAGISRLMLTLLAAGTLVLMEKFSVEGLADIVEQRRPTGFLLIPPTFIYRLSDALAQRGVDTSCVERVDTGSTIVSPDVIMHIFDTFPRARVLTGYGQSECHPVTFSLMTRHACERNPRLLDSMGRLGPFVEARVVDESGAQTETGCAGELQLRSPMTMRRTEGNADAFCEGWLKTGDMVRCDEEGRYYFLGRLRDVVKSGGEYVSPAEVECAVIGHPGVLDCKVVGIPSDDFGEILVAGVVVDPGAAVSERELKEFCGATLAHFKVPKRFIFFDRFERTATGKVRTEAVREAVLREMGA